jgi:hypothetical protein
MTVRLRTAAIAVACLLGSIMSDDPLAATYKCSLGGKHTYQDQPCATDVSERGSESRVDTLVPRTGMGRSMSREDITRLNARVQADLVPIARTAFEALRAGDVGSYLNLLCPRARIAAAGSPTVRASLAQQGDSFARGGTRLLSIASSDYQKVTFSAIDETVLPGKVPLSGVIITQFDYEGDRPCIRAVERAGS